VLRDVLATRRLAMVLAMFYVLYLAMEARSPEMSLLTTFVFTLAFTLGGLALDARRGAEALWASLPFSRATLVRGRYLAVATLGSASLAVSWLVGRLAAGPLGADAPPLPPAVFPALLVVILLVAALYLPFHFKLGPGAGLAAFSLVAAAFLVTGAAMSQAVAWLLGSPDALLQIATWRSAGRVASGGAAGSLGLSAAAIVFATLAITGALFLLSMRVSEQLYRERDL